NQMTNITRANGVSSAFTYDNDAQLLSITHAKGATIIDTESYGYDPAGNRGNHSTSLGQSLITAATANSFDKANELIQYGSTPYSYDVNGNLTQDGIA